MPSVKSAVKLIPIDLTSKDTSWSWRGGRIRLLFFVSLRFLLFNSLPYSLPFIHSLLTHSFGCGNAALGYDRLLTRRPEDPVIAVLSLSDGGFVVGEDESAAVIVAVVAEGGVKDLIAEKDDAAGGNLTVYRIGQIHLAR